MKKILSIVLCLALVFSICSYGLTSNAVREYDSCTIVYCFNNESFFVRFIVVKQNYEYTSYIMDVYSKSDATEYNRRIKQYIDVPGTLDLEDIFEEYLPECDLLERLDSHFGYSAGFSKYYTVSEFFNKKLLSVDVSASVNEDDIAYIISTVNPSNLVQCDIRSNAVEDTSPIIDALLLTCKESLSSVDFSCNKISVIDNRLFTEFPKINSDTSIDLRGCNIWRFNDSPYISQLKITGVGDTDQKIYYKISMKECLDTLAYYGYDEELMSRTYFEEKLLPNIVAPEGLYYYGCFALSCLEGCVSLYCTFNNKNVIIGHFDYYGIIEADPTKDGVVDTFDVAMTTEYVNTFEEPEDEAVKFAMDVVEDGYIDATDLAYVSYIANFEE